MRYRNTILLAGVLALLSITVIAAPAGHGSVSATVDGKPILFSEIEAKAAGDIAREESSFNESQRRAQLAHRVMLQSLREATLEGLIRERTLAAESLATGKSVEEILATHTAAEPTNEEMLAYYKANATASAPPYDQVVNVIRERLQAQSEQKAQAALAHELRANHAVQWLLPREHLEVGIDGPTRGADNAPIILVEFADFQCPYCNRLEPLVKSALKHYPTQLRQVFRQLPIVQLHPGAQLAAQASLCAAEQSQFWPMHDALFAFFAAKGTLDESELALLGEGVGLESGSFDACLKSGRVDSIIARDTAAADQLGVDGTPALFLNGRPLRGGVTEETLFDAIDEELVRLAHPHR